MPVEGRFFIKTLVMNKVVNAYLPHAPYRSYPPLTFFYLKDFEMFTHVLCKIDILETI